MQSFLLPISVCLRPYLAKHNPGINRRRRPDVIPGDLLARVNPICHAFTSRKYLHEDAARCPELHASAISQKIPVEDGTMQRIDWMKLWLSCELQRIDLGF